MPEIDPVTVSADPLQDLIPVQCCCRKIALVHHIDHKGKKHEITPASLGFAGSVTS